VDLPFPLFLIVYTVYHLLNQRATPNLNQNINVINDLAEKILQLYQEVTLAGIAGIGSVVYYNIEHSGCQPFYYQNKIIFRLLFGILYAILSYKINKQEKTMGYMKNLCMDLEEKCWSDVADVIAESKHISEAMPKAVEIFAQEDLLAYVTTEQIEEGVSEMWDLTWNMYKLG